MHFYFFLYFLSCYMIKSFFFFGGRTMIKEEFSLWIVNIFTIKCSHLCHSMLFALNSFCLIWLLLYFIFVFPIMYVKIVLFSISFSFLCFRSYFLRIGLVLFYFIFKIRYDFPSGLRKQRSETVGHLQDMLPLKEEA